MDTENEWSSDLNNILTDFLNLKESSLKEQKLRQEFQITAKQLQEENKVIRELEAAERNKLNISRNFVIQQQETISNLLGVRNENIKLTEHIKEVQATVDELKRKLLAEEEKWQNTQEKMKLRHTQQINELKLISEKRVMEAKNEVENVKAKFQLQYAELARKLEDLKNSKSNEINVIVFEYEEKLTGLEERLKATVNENHLIRNRAAADITIYKKKILAMEQQYDNLLREKRELQQMSPFVYKSADTSLPGTRNKMFKYHAPNINQNELIRTPLQSILKKTSAYDLVQTPINKKIFLSSPNDFKIPEQIRLGSSNSTEHTTVKENKVSDSDIHNAVPVLRNESPNNTKIPDSVPSRNETSVTQSLETEIHQTIQISTHPALDISANTPSKEASTRAPRGRRTKFATAKKRKLFCSNNLDE